MHVPRILLRIKSLCMGYNCYYQMLNKSLCRQRLAGLHYNENHARQQAQTADGHLRYSIVFPKAKKGDYTVRPVKTKPTFSKFHQKLSVL